MGYIILIVIAAIILTILIAAGVSSNIYVIQQEIIINRPVQEVFNYIKISRNQDFYNKWWMIDPNARKEFIGTDAAPGFIMKWDSDNKQAGKGEQEITGITDGKRVDYEIRFIKPFEGKAVCFMETFAAGEGKTKVIWHFSGHRNFVMRIFHLLFSLPKMLGKDLLQSLTNLKALLEK